MKKTRRAFSLFLAILLCLGLLPMGALADEEAPIPEEGEAIVQRAEAPAAESAEDLPVDGATASFTTVAAAGQYLREQMVARKSSVDIQFTASYSPDWEEVQEIADQILDKALEHTGVPWEGDYLRMQCIEWGESMSWSGRKISLTYTFQFTTTAQQEAAVTAKLASVLPSVVNSSMSDYQAIKAIYDYIMGRVTYDNVNLNNDNYLLKFSAYAALINGTAVCQGYSSLLYRMLLEIGVDSRIVSGWGNGGNHAWNIIRLGGKYYHADVTWDDGGWNYAYFLKARFRDHYTDEAFLSTYPMASTDYNAASAAQTNTRQVDLQQPVLKSAANTATGVTVSWSAVTGAAKYRVYRKTASTGWTAVKDVTGTSFTDTSVASGTAYTYTVRAIAGSAISAYDKTGKTVTYLAQPTLKSAVKAAKGVTVTWSAVTGAEKYRVYRKTASTGWTAVKDVTGTSFADTSVASGTAYTYTVRAIKGSAISAYDTKGISTSASSSSAALAQPVLKSAANTTSGVTVTWGTVTGAEKYRVYRKTASTGWKTVKDVTATSFTDTAVTSGTKYTYTVRAIKGNTISPYDTAGKSITYIAAPVLKSAENAAAGVTITWTKSAGAERYRIYRKTGSGSWTNLADVGNVGTYTDTTAQSGTTYTYTVRCLSADGKSLISAYNATGLTIKASTTGDLSEEAVYQKIIAMKSSYPEGTPWTNSNKYAGKGGFGWGCAGFAFLLSDAAFGDLPARLINTIDYDALRVGDILRINNDTHSVVILEKHPTYVVLAEGNYGSTVHWGRTLSKSIVLDASYYITRYPEN